MQLKYWTAAVLFLQLHNSPGISALESSPDHINGQLLACVGDQISLTCSRDFELSTGVTYWTISSPTIPCDSLINHLPPVSISGLCNLFMFQNITVVDGPVTNFSSTAIATANTSMSGAVIQCFTSSIPQLSVPIGPNITLCIPDQLLPPDNIQVSLSANGTVQMSWDRPPLVCSARNISYNINLVSTDGNPVDEGFELSVTTEEMSITFSLTPGREYRAFLIAINTDCSISSCAIQIIFTATQGPIPGTTTTPSAPGALTTQPTAPHQQCSSAVAISVLVTFVTTLGVTAVLSSVITCCVMKRRNTWPLPSPKAVTQEQPVYEEALASVSREEIIEMGENVAYGPVVR